MATDLVFMRDGAAHTLDTVVVAVLAYADLPSASRALFKLPPDLGEADVHALVTEATVFHPQGGGQPSDTGTVAAGDAVFSVLSARMDGLRVLHFGTGDPAAFAPGTRVAQHIDAAKRLLYSRLHTAGHVLGASVRKTCAATVAGFAETKASHFPDAASCEFAGTIDGAFKPAIQAQLDAFLAADAAVSIDWWDAEDFRRHGHAHQIPAGPMPADKWRVVCIAGCEAYPCGGTHVPTTAACGATTVTKISRSKGASRVSYKLADTGH